GSDPNGDDRGIGPQPDSPPHGARPRAFPGPDEPGVVTRVAQSMDQFGRELLDPSGQSQVVGAHHSDLHLIASKSLGQFGCTRCHCAGAAPMSASNSSASAWVTARTRAPRSVPDGMTSGGRTTT